jgi:hypothetical protein
MLRTPQNQSCEFGQNASPRIATSLRYENSPAKAVSPVRIATGEGEVKLALSVRHQGTHMQVEGQPESEGVKLRQSPGSSGVVPTSSETVSNKPRRILKIRQSALPSISNDIPDNAMVDASAAVKRKTAAQDVPVEKRAKTSAFPEPVSSLRVVMPPGSNEEPCLRVVMPKKQPQAAHEQGPSASVPDSVEPPESQDGPVTELESSSSQLVPSSEPESAEAIEAEPSTTEVESSVATSKAPVPIPIPILAELPIEPPLPPDEALTLPATPASSILREAEASVQQDTMSVVSNADLRQRKASDNQITDPYSNSTETALITPVDSPVLLEATLKAEEVPESGELVLPSELLEYLDLCEEARGNIMLQRYALDAMHELLWHLPDFMNSNGRHVTGTKIWLKKQRMRAVQLAMVERAQQWKDVSERNTAYIASLT